VPRLDRKTVQYVQTANVEELLSPAARTYSLDQLLQPLLLTNKSHAMLLPLKDACRDRESTPRSALAVRRSGPCRLVLADVRPPNENRSAK
jgi:hypothetical protein